MGWWPPETSTIASRRIASPTGPSIQSPSPSGPRWRSTSRMRLRRASSTVSRGSSLTMPTIPHMAVSDSGGGGGGERPIVEDLEARQHPVEAKMVSNVLARSGGQRSRAHRIRDQPRDRAGERRRVARRHEEAGPAVFDQTGNATHARGDDRKSHRHRLQERVRARFADRRENEDVELAKGRFRLSSHPPKLDHLLEPELSHEPLERRPARTVSPDDESHGGAAGLDQRRRANEVGDRLLRPQHRERTDADPARTGRC